MPRAPRAGRVWPTWLLAAVLLGCGGKVVWVDDPSSPAFRHRGLGYSIGHPGGDDWSVWRQVDVDGADLAFRRGDGAALSVSSECRKTSAPVGVLAQHLVIGTSRDDLLAAAPVELGGDQGFSQTFDTLEGEVPVRVKAVTLVGDSCVFDFVAVAPAPGSFDQVEEVFDRWWTTFQRVPAEAGGEAGDSRSAAR